MRTVHTFFIILIIAVTACAKTYYSTEQKTLSTSEKVFQQSSGMRYHISNSPDSLFLDIQFIDPVTAKKVLTFGFNVWLDPTAKKNKTYGIQFPVALDKEHLKPPKPYIPQVVEDEDGFKRLKYKKTDKHKNPSLKNRTQEYILLGFNNQDTTILANDNSSDISLKLYYTDHTLCYRLALAHSKIFPEEFSKDPKPFSIGLVTGHLHPSHQHNTNSYGRTATYGQSSMSGNITRMTIPTKVWIKKVKLNIE